MTTRKSTLERFWKNICLPCNKHGSPNVVNSPEESSRFIVLEEASLTQLDQLLHGVEKLLEATRAAKSRSKYSIDLKIEENVEEVGSEWIGRIRRCSDEIQGRDFMKEMEKVLVNVLGASKQVHWIFVGISIIGWVLMRMDQRDQNFTECLVTMEKLLNLCKDLKRLLGDAGNYSDTYIRPHVLEGIALVLDGSARCCTFVKRTPLYRFVTCESGKNELIHIREKINRFQVENIAKVSIDTLERVRAVEAELASAHARDIESASSALKDVTSGIYEVGLEKPVHELMNMLDFGATEKVVAVVLYGMGGIGKSKLAGIVYSSKAPFLVSNRCFIVLGQSPDRAKVVSLQNRMIEQLSHRKSEISEYAVARKELGCCLQSRKEPLFLLIDSVLDSKDLSDLLPEKMCLPKGSRLVVTTRDMSVCTTVLASKHMGMDNVQSYGVDCLDGEDAQKLLCLHAFEQEDPPPKYRKLISEVVDAAGRLPLAIEVVGTQLRNRELAFWKSAVEEIRLGRSRVVGKGGRDEVADHVLRFSYEQLTVVMKKAFVFVSTCVEGGEWTRSCGFVQALGFPAESLEVLESLMMVKNGRQGRRWNFEYALDVSTCRLIKDAISRSIPEVDPCLVQMHDLFIALGKTLANVRVCRSLNELQIDHIMDVGNVEHLYIGERFLEAVTGLNAPHSSTEQIRVLEINTEEEPAEITSGPGNVFTSKLMTTFCSQVADSSYRYQLKSAEDCQFKCLRALVIEDKSLLKLPENFSTTMFPNLRYLGLLCPKLKELPDNLGNLTSLQVLRGTSLKCWNLPATIGKLSNLRVLELWGGLEPWRGLDLWRGCCFLSGLPLEIGELSSLEHLNLDCPQLYYIPPQIGQLRSLRTFCLRSLWLTELPDEMNQLSTLEFLMLCCDRLTNIPHGMDRCSSLTSLWIRSLSRLTTEILSLVRLEYLDCRDTRDISGISRLVNLKVLWCRDFHAEINRLQLLEYLAVDDCSSRLEVGPLPGLRMISAYRFSSSPEFRELPSLKSLVLNDSETVTEIRLDTRHLPSLQYLNLADNLGLLRLPPELNQFTSLLELVVSGCNENIIQTIPEELRLLPHLTIHTT